MTEPTIDLAIQQAKANFASADSAGKEAVITDMGQLIGKMSMESAVKGEAYAHTLPLFAARHELVQTMPDSPFKTRVQQRSVPDVESVCYSVQNDKAADPMAALPVIEMQRVMANALPPSQFKTDKLAWAPKFMGQLADTIAKTDPAGAVLLRQRQVELAQAVPAAMPKPKAAGTSGPG